MAQWKEVLATDLKLARGTDTQARVAARSGLSDRTIGLIEQKRVKTKPRAETIVRLAFATGSDPEEWLGKLGLTMVSDAIERVRGQVRTIARLDKLQEPEEIKRDVINEIERIMRTKLSEVGVRLPQLEPAEELKQQLKKYVHDHVDTALANVEPAHKIRKELTAYVDMRLHNIEQMMQDIVHRIDRLQAVSQGRGRGVRLIGRRPKEG